MKVLSVKVNQSQFAPRASLLMLYFTLLIIERSLTMKYQKKEIPQYYKTMYQDGYTPEEILHAKRKEMLKIFSEREVLRASEDFDVQINSKVDVKK